MNRHQTKETVTPIMYQQVAWSLGNKALRLIKKKKKKLTVSFFNRQGWWSTIDRTAAIARVQTTSR